jgi:probable phosphoglycerate mutase
MKKTVLTIVRHGQTEWNRIRRMQGQSDILLNPTGKNQVRQLREKLKRTPFDIIIASPLGRTRQTAQILARGRRVHFDARFKERNHGHLEGLHPEQVEVRFPTLKQDQAKHGIDWHPGGSGETSRVFQKRVVDAVKDVLHQHRGKRILLVTHGGVMRSIITWAHGIKPEHIFGIRHPKNAEHACVVHDGTHCHVAFYPELLKKH